jgi:hypothetical protein
VLLILLALGIAIYATVHVTRSLEPGQRLVAWVVFVFAIVWLFWKLTQMGVLGRATSGEG